MCHHQTPVMTTCVVDCPMPCLPLQQLLGAFLCGKPTRTRHRLHAAVCRWCACLFARSAVGLQLCEQKMTEPSMHCCGIPYSMPGECKLDTGPITRRAGASEKLPLTFRSVVMYVLLWKFGDSKPSASVRTRMSNG